MTTINTIHTLQTYKDAYGKEFVKDLPKELLDGIVAAASKVYELEERINDLLGDKTVRIGEMARILGVSVHTINTWKTRENLLKEGFHFEKRGGHGIFYNVKNMRKFKLEEAMAEKLAEKEQKLKEELARLNEK